MLNFNTKKICLKKIISQFLVFVMIFVTCSSGNIIFAKYEQNNFDSYRYSCVQSNTNDYNICFDSKFTVVHTDCESFSNMKNGGAYNCGPNIKLGNDIYAFFDTAFNESSKNEIEEHVAKQWNINNRTAGKDAVIVPCMYKVFEEPCIMDYITNGRISNAFRSRQINYNVINEIFWKINSGWCFAFAKLPLKCNGKYVNLLYAGHVSGVENNEENSNFNECDIKIAESMNAQYRYWRVSNGKFDVFYTFILPDLNDEESKNDKFWISEKAYEIAYKELKSDNKEILNALMNSVEENSNKYEKVITKIIKIIEKNGSVGKEEADRLLNKYKKNTSDKKKQNKRESSSNSGSSCKDKKTSASTILPNDNDATYVIDKKMIALFCRKLVEKLKEELCEYE